MWRKLPNSMPLFLSFTKENGYCIYITDYIKIWWAHYKEDEFLRLLKKSNDDLEMENDEELLQLGLKMLSQPENLKKVKPVVRDKSLHILMTISCGFPVYLEMQLAEGSREMFFKKITQQFLKTIQDLKASESELRSSLIKKDKEIDEYKSETDVRLAMYLKTGVFRDEEHMGKHSMYETHFGMSEVPDCLLEKFIQETEDRVSVKQENQVEQESKVKVELDSQQVIKNETDPVPENETQNLSSSGTIKREIKSEPFHISPKKRHRRMLKI